jgi:hypothetical protein
VRAELAEQSEQDYQPDYHVLWDHARKVLRMRRREDCHQEVLEVREDQEDLHLEDQKDFPQEGQKDHHQEDQADQADRENLHWADHHEVVLQVVLDRNPDLGVLRLAVGMVEAVLKLAIVENESQSHAESFLEVPAIHQSYVGDEEPQAVNYLSNFEGGLVEP